PCPSTPLFRSARRPPGLRGEVHRRQTARDRRDPLAAGSAGTLPPGAGPAGRTGAPMNARSRSLVRRAVVLFIATTALGGSAAAQAARRAAVPDRQAPDTATVDFVASGVRVILRRNAANDVVAANLY